MSTVYIDDKELRAYLESVSKSDATDALNYLRITGENIARNVLKNNTDGTGQSAESITSESDNQTARIYSELSFMIWVLQGRGPGKMPPIDAIRDWAISHGINPWALARKIANSGTQRYREHTDLYQEIIDEIIANIPDMISIFLEGF